MDLLKPHRTMAVREEVASVMKKYLPHRSVSVFPIPLRRRFAPNDSSSSREGESAGGGGGGKQMRELMGGSEGVLSEGWGLGWGRGGGGRSLIGSEKGRGVHLLQGTPLKASPASLIMHRWLLCARDRSSHSPMRDDQVSQVQFQFEE
jgi:hypothetical protein